MMKLALLVLLSSLALSFATVAQVVEFANANWNCANVACTEKVAAGSGQSNYECAEFVSRSLAAGGYIPLESKAAQSDYLNFKHNGVAYDLLWVSSKQGGPKGLEDYLRAVGWKTANNTNVEAGYALMLRGSAGPYSHTAIGVGKGISDAHNVAHYQVPLSAYEGVELIYVPPN